MLIGVAKLINKLNGLPFDENDEIYFEVCGQEYDVIVV